jgi:hypothetical protein
VALLGVLYITPRTRDITIDTTEGKLEYKESALVRDSSKVSKEGSSVGVSGAFGGPARDN